MADLRRTLATALLVAALGSTALAAQPTDASWQDREIASGTFTAKTIPPVTIAGTAPYCSWTSLIVTTSISFQFALPPGYALSDVRFLAQNGAVTQPITGATSTVDQGVYTTTIPVSLLNAIGNLLGGVVTIHVTVLDAPTGWSSRRTDYSYGMGLAGIVLTCSATAT